MNIKRAAAQGFMLAFVAIVFIFLAVLSLMTHVDHKASQEAKAIGDNIQIAEINYAPMKEQDEVKVVQIPRNQWDRDHRCTYAYLYSGCYKSVVVAESIGDFASSRELTRDSGPVPVISIPLKPEFTYTIWAKQSNGKTRLWKLKVYLVQYSSSSLRVG